MRNVVYNFVIPCFIFELYIILYDWLMTSFCLQKVMKMYEAGYVPRRKLTPQIKTQGYGQESLSFRGSLLWNTLDDSVKNEPTLSAFKRRIKDWAGDNCTCKICR